MFRSIFCTLFLIGLVTSLAAGDPQKKAKPDEVRKKFYACWLELDRVDAGVAIKDPVHLCGLQFAENGYWVWGRRGELSTGVDSDQYRVRIDGTAEPMRVDIIAPTRAAPPGKHEMVQLGIFKFDGDKLIVAVAPWAMLEPPDKGKDYPSRPKTFESTKENKVMLSTYKPTDFFGVD